MTTSYFAERAWLPEGWRQNVRIDVDERGTITDTRIDSPGDAAGDAAIRLSGSVIPGLANVHSHAFQRAMAGLAERASGDMGSFWTWRQVMYKLARHITPDRLEVIARQAYIEMLKAGFTAVGEFHYLHNDADGTPYVDPAELSRRAITAARDVGLAITHLPVLYMRAGFDGGELTPAQRRFTTGPERLLDIAGDLRRGFAGDPDVTIGLAIHSLRAVAPEDLLTTVVAARAESDDTAVGPIHIHAAEQPREVEGARAALGAPPVAWLLDQAGVDAGWCLVHATHMTAEERDGLARSGAVAGLCPITEANLGDGLFPLPGYLKAGGRIGIGSDSNVCISAIEELRLLEYGQRLFNGRRPATKVADGGSPGAALYNRAAMGGALALGRRMGALITGARADFVVLDGDHPALAAAPEAALFDRLLFAASQSPVRDVYVGGHHVVTDGHHPREAETLAAFARLVGELAETL